jgi:hypothetical protein
VKKIQQALKNKRLNSLLNKKIIVPASDNTKNIQGHIPAAQFSSRRYALPEMARGRVGEPTRMMKNFYPKRTATQYFSLNITGLHMSRFYFLAKESTKCCLKIV